MMPRKFPSIPFLEEIVTESDCLFCRIAAGEIPAQIVRSTPDLVAFRDINPQAPTHILVVPRKHIPSVAEMEPDDGPILGSLFLAARELAEEEGVAGDGYRMVINSGEGAGQSVFHVHLHVLGGREMRWPPG